MNLVFFFVTTLIWGTTWLAIHFQIGHVAPIWSVVYRFGLASCLLLAFCLATGRSLRFTRAQHMTIALQGILLFSLNYVLFYVASEDLVSGLVAVSFGSITIMNSMNSLWFFKTRLIPRVLLGSLIGLIGLAFVFDSGITNHFAAKANNSHVISALFICLLATYLASLGNMVSVSNQKQQVPIIESNALGMAYGTLFTAALALIFRVKMSFDWSAHYLFSLVYLAIFGSIFAFGFYLKLLSKIGAERAAYIGVVTPIIAMIISTIFEGFDWKIITVLGIILVVCGNTLVLRRKKVTAETGQ